MVLAAESRGVTTSAVLAEAGLTCALLEDPDSRIPAPTVIDVWNVLRERTNDPALQLAAPMSLPFGAYRVIDYLVGASATVGAGMQRFARYFQLIADAVTLTIESTSDTYALCVVMADGRPVPPVYVDYIFAALVGRVRMRIRPALEVLRVELRQRPPADCTPWTATFCAPVHFDAPADRLCFSHEEWYAPLDSADEALAHVLEEHARILATRTGSATAGFTGEVQRAIAAALPEGASVADIARALHVSVRTLQRHLIASGTTYREVQDAVRDRLAREYLSDSSVSIAEVACLLGFSDQSSFNRRFRRWTGESPGRWRRRRAGRV
jgi:AraC-like DNA-binding protein